MRDAMHLAEEPNMKRVSALSVSLALILAAGAAHAAGGDPKAGKEKAQTCASCHGEKGRAGQANYPKLAGQHADYLYRALAQYKSGERQNNVMAGMVSDLSDQDMRDLAAYYANQEAAVFTMPRSGD